MLSIEDKTSITLDVQVPTAHIFQDPDDIGVRLIIGQIPTPFATQLAAPANTHALIIFEFVYTSLTSDCYSIQPHLEHLIAYSQETCLIEAVEASAKNICGCSVIAGEYYPRNGVACTPRIMKECVQPQILYPLLDSRKVRPAAYIGPLSHLWYSLLLS